MAYFRCAECGCKGFSNTDELETHIVKEHYGGRCFYECTEVSCGACFHTARRLLRHYVTVHNHREDNSETSIKLSISNSLNNSINSSFDKAIMNPENDAIYEDDIPGSSKNVVSKKRKLDTQPKSTRRYFPDKVILSVLAYFDVSYIFRYSKVVSHRFRDLAQQQIHDITSTSYKVDARACGSLSLLPVIFEGTSQEILICDGTYTNDVQIPLTQVAEFLCGGTALHARGRRQLLITTTYSPNRDVIIEEIKQAFLDSKTPLDFSFMWTHWNIENWPVVVNGPNEMYDVVNSVTNQRLMIFSQWSQFRLKTEDANDNHLNGFALERKPPEEFAKCPICKSEQNTQK
ncbi:hypothetical protein Ddc_10991 [Ditylenchus destructor]|nr:hypothetical protein Ddc_10991 [Ditylenchus destructor]